jgi:hypothetical protein
METRESTNSGAAAWGELNVGMPERIASVGAGAMLALFGMRRGGFTGALVTLTGGSLLMRGVTGHCPAYGALGINTAEQLGGPDADTYGYGRHEEQSFELHADEGGTHGSSPEPRAGEEPL